MKQNKGFTLIELLVVISIISLLSSVILASLNAARAKSRDASRARSVLEMQKAISMYFSANGSYPDTGGQWWGNCSGFGSHPTSGATGYVPNVAPTYISVLPVDPKQSAGACFIYRSNKTDYFLMAYLTYEGTPPASKIRPLLPAQKNFAVYSDGARMW